MASFNNRATKVTNFVQIESSRFWTFDDGRFAYDVGAGIVCCTARGRSLANNGHYAPLVDAMRMTIARFEKEVEFKGIDADGFAVFHLPFKL